MTILGESEEAGGESAPDEDLRSFLRRLRTTSSDALISVRRRVDAVHELSEVSKRLERLGAPAVLFEDVAESEFPVVTGLFGTRQRIASILGVHPRCAVREALKRARDPGSCRLVGDAPVHEVRHLHSEVSLASLPLPVHSRGDAGRYISSAVGLVRDPATGRVNFGIYRLMLVDDHTLTVNVVPGNRLGRILAKACSESRRVEAAFVIGAAPIFVLASQAGVGKERDCFELASALAGRTLSAAPAITVDLPVPAEAEIVLEGVIDPTRQMFDGPFGEFTSYPGASMAATCTVTAITHRNGAIYHDIHPTHREHRYLWLYPGREGWLLHQLSAIAPCVKEVVIPEFGAFLVAILAVAPEHVGDARQALLATLSCDNMVKIAVAVDTDIDVWDAAAVAWAIAVRSQSDRDLIVVGELSGVHNDPSSIAVGEQNRPDHVTAKLGVDATVPLRSAFPERSDLPAPAFEDLDLGGYVSAEVLRRLGGRFGANEWVPV